MRIGALLLLAGCQNLFGIRQVTEDGHRPADASDAQGLADAPADGTLLPDAPALPQLRLAQQSANENVGTGLDLVLPHPVTTGDALILVGGATCGVDAIAGGGVTFWDSAAQSTISPTVYIYYGFTDGTSSSVHLTPHCTTDTWGVLSEWSGLAAATPDASNHMGAATSVPGTLDITPNLPDAPDLIVLGVASYGPLGSPAGGWTEMQPITSSSVTQRSWYEKAITAGTYPAQISYQNDYDAAVAAFRVQ